jgi:hypothetical protein
MSHIETTRLNDLIALKIGAIKEFAQAMTVDSEVQELEALVAELEDATAELKTTLEAIPHHPA